MDRSAAEMATATPVGDSEHFKSLELAFEGHIQQARQESIQAVTLARGAHLPERAALFEGAAAVREALYGNPAESARQSSAVEQIINGRDSDFPPAFASALSGNFATALRIVKKMEALYPEDTCIRFTYSPSLRALLAIHQGNPSKAIDLLTVSKPYELAQNGVSLYVHYGALYPTYVRGLAYQQLHRYKEAAAEFQRMLDHPELLLADPIGPAARVQLARALRDVGDTAGAKAAYQDFLTLWKNADQEIPLLRQAKADLSRL
jgi:eukaryotic-like serine/threonine-protein kinase